MEADNVYHVHEKLRNIWSRFEFIRHQREIYCQKEADYVDRLLEIADEQLKNDLVNRGFTEETEQFEEEFDKRRNCYDYSSIKPEDVHRLAPMDQAFFERASELTIPAFTNNYLDERLAVFSILYPDAPGYSDALRLYVTLETAYLKAATVLNGVYLRISDADAQALEELLKPIEVQVTLFNRITQKNPQAFFTTRTDALLDALQAFETACQEWKQSALEKAHAPGGQAPARPTSPSEPAP